MKINSPVTNQEHHFTADESLYSRTDLHGNILEVNANFERLSGFKRAELYGQPHNHVRHPDMPPAAFKDLWANLRQGRSWRGIIKNWNKDGGFYWVDANVSAVRDAERKVQGYQSVRFKPSAQEIAEAAAAYAKIQAGASNLTIQQGRVVTTSLIQRLAQSRLLLGCTITLCTALPTLVSIYQPHRPWLALSLLPVLPLFLFWLNTRYQQSLHHLTGWLDELLTQGSLVQTKPNLAYAGGLNNLGNLTEDLVRAMRATLKGVEDVSQRVANATQESHQAAQKVVAASNNQSQASAASATALQQMRSSVNSVANQAEQTQNLVQLAGQEAHNANQDSHKASASIERLVTDLQATATQIKDLGQRSDEIENIIGLITSVAEQTNLLALNAAIEAARAGTHGRGFAVVADEVRNLSDHTTQATQKISAQLGNIRSATLQAIQAMAANQKQADSSMQEVQKVTASLGQISSTLQQSVQMTNAITLATQEQQEVISQLATETTRISELAANNVGVAQSAQAATTRLNSLSQRLLEAVRQYQI